MKLFLKYQVINFWSVLLMLIIRQDISTRKKNTETVLGASKEAGLGVNVDEHVWLCIVSRVQNKIMIANKPLDTVTEFLTKSW